MPSGESSSLSRARSTARGSSRGTRSWAPGAGAGAGRAREEGRTELPEVQVSQQTRMDVSVKGESEESRRRGLKTCPEQNSPVQQPYAPHQPL